MTNVLRQFAQAAAETGSDPFSALGIDWKMLVFQVIAFLILVWLLTKYVFPPLLKAVDDRQAKIEESTKAADEAEKRAAKAEKTIDDTLKQARLEASEIVATAKTEAAEAIANAETAAKQRTERIAAEAREELQKDVVKARELLSEDALEMVKQAASLATGNIADEKLDNALIKKSIAEVKQ